jgi:hypothetical protein
MTLEELQHAFLARVTQADSTAAVDEILADTQQGLAEIPPSYFITPMYFWARMYAKLLLRKSLLLFENREAGEDTALAYALDELRRLSNSA